MIKRWVFLFAIAMAFSFPSGAAQAEGTTVSAQISSERNPSDFADILDSVYKFEASHGFENGLFFNGFFEVQTPAENGPNKENVEGNVGFAHTIAGPLSLSASGGIGGRFTEGDGFAYYVFRIGSTVKVTDWLSWNIVTFRYRDGFHASDDYKTPRLTTKATFHLDAHDDFYVELYRNYNGDWEPTANAVAVGYSYRF